MPRDFFCFDALHDSKSAAAVLLMISIKNLFVSSFTRQPDAMAFAHQRREVSDEDDFCSRRRCDATKRDNVFSGVVDFDPAEPADICVGFPQRSVLCIESV